MHHTLRPLLFTSAALALAALPLGCAPDPAPSTGRCAEGPAVLDGRVRMAAVSGTVAGPADALYPQGPEVVFIDRDTRARHALPLGAGAFSGSVPAGDYRVELGGAIADYAPGPAGPIVLAEAVTIADGFSADWAFSAAVHTLRITRASGLPRGDRGVLHFRGRGGGDGLTRVIPTQSAADSTEVTIALPGDSEMYFATWERVPDVFQNVPPIEAQTLPYGQAGVGAFGAGLPGTETRGEITLPDETATVQITLRALGEPLPSLDGSDRRGLLLGLGTYGVQVAAAGDSTATWRMMPGDYTAAFLPYASVEGAYRGGQMVSLCPGETVYPGPSSLSLQPRCPVRADTTALGFDAPVADPVVPPPPPPGPSTPWTGQISWTDGASTPTGADGGIWLKTGETWTRVYTDDTGRFSAEDVPEGRYDAWFVGAWDPDGPAPVGATALGQVDTTRPYDATVTAHAVSLALTLNGEALPDAENTDVFTRGYLKLKHAAPLGSETELDLARTGAFAKDVWLLDGEYRADVSTVYEATRVPHVLPQNVLPQGRWSVGERAIHAAGTWNLNVQTVPTEVRLEHTDALPAETFLWLSGADALLHVPLADAENVALPPGTYTVFRSAQHMSARWQGRVPEDGARMGTLCVAP